MGLHDLNTYLPQNIINVLSIILSAAVKEQVVYQII